MMNSPKDLSSWTGNIEELAEKVGDVMRQSGRPEVEPPTTRLVRDYIQRGLLGPVPRSGKELVFDYSHLVRFVATRVLLGDVKMGNFIDIMEMDLVPVSDVKVPTKSFSQVQVLP